LNPLITRMPAAMFQFFQVRPFNLLAAGACAALLAYAYYTQFFLGLEPCPLCVFQRIAMIALFMSFLLGAALGAGPRRSKMIAALIAITAGGGAGIAGRHVWLQSLPPEQVPACGPGLDYMLDVFPLWEVLEMVFTASGECAEVDWSFLGLSMPAWVLGWFIVLGATGVWVNWRSGRPPF
jgi:disulfide bond formation protein DsbB